MAAKKLEWRRPKNDGQDYGQEDASWLADGISGMYAIMPDALLWWAHDPFTWAQFNSINEAKEAAEADWQKRYAALAAQEKTDGE